MAMTGRRSYGTTGARRTGSATAARTGSARTGSYRTRSVALGAGEPVTFASEAAEDAEPLSPLAVLGRYGDGNGKLWGFWDARSVLEEVGVAQWTDLTGNDRHFTQASGPSQATLVEDGHNGLAHVEFDGVDHYYTIDGTSIAAGNFVSMFVLARSDHAYADPGTPLVFWKNGAHQNIQFLAALSDDTWRAQVFYGGGNLTEDSTARDDQVTSLRFVWGLHSKPRFYHDGTHIGTFDDVADNDGTDETYDRFGLGNNAIFFTTPFAGDILAVYVVVTPDDNAITADEYTALNEWEEWRSGRSFAHDA